MIAMTLAEVAEAVDGRLVGPDGCDHWLMTAEATHDSRAVTPGSLFVALPGEHADGHSYVPMALAAGAVAALTSRPIDSIDGPLPCIVVAEVLNALALLARAVLDRLPDCIVIGITGSSGKTSAKDLLAVLLADLAPTVVTPGNNNNELGLPLTVLRATADTRFLVLEMGARHLGNIAALCRTGRPTVGVVLNVGSAHIGEFGSQQAIAATKRELPESLPASGLCVLNGDDALVSAMASRTAARVVTVGESVGTTLRISELHTDDQARASFTLTTAGPVVESARVSLRLHGEHHASNAAAVAAVALELGMDLARAAELLSSAESVSHWRMEVTTTDSGLTLVNDAYNANPESMRAALKSLRQMATAADGTRRRTWAVLGAMRELGHRHVADHDAIGRLAVRLDINQLVVIGADAKAMHLGAGMEGSWDSESIWVPDAGAALQVLAERLEPGDVVLVKASRSEGLERLPGELSALQLPARSPGARDDRRVPHPDFGATTHDEPAPGTSA